jgi:ribosomal protein L11 methyltransferase
MIADKLKWLELSAVVAADRIDELASIFGKYGYGGAVVEEWPEDSGNKTFVVKIYLPCNRSVNGKKSRLMDDIKQLHFPIQLEEHTLEPGEWLNAWKKYFNAFEIGEKLVIKPGWQSEPASSRSRKIIELDPGMAFGTGLHATTRLTLLRLEKHLEPGMSVLDLGTGSGILAIAAAKLGAASVLAMDIDPVAVSAAASNVEKNKVSDIVQVKKDTLNKTTCRRLKGYFDLIICNITASVISDLAHGLAVVLKPGGRLIASGISDAGLDEVLIKLVIEGLKIEAIDSEGEWHAVVAGKAENTKFQAPNSKQ